MREGYPRNAQEIRPRGYSCEQRRTLRARGAGGRVSAGGVRESHQRAPARGVSVEQAGAGGNVCAEIRGYSEYLESFREVGVWVGFGVCGGQGRFAGTYPRDGCGSCAEWRARERDLSGAGDGNGDEQGTRQHARQEIKREP